MDRRIKLAIFLLVGVMIVFLALLAILWGERGRLERSNQELFQQVNALEQNIDSLKNQIMQGQGVQRNLEAELQKAGRQNEEMKSQLASAAQTRDELAKQLKYVSGLQKATAEDIAKERQARSRAEAELARLKEYNLLLRRERDSLVRRKAGLEKKLEELTAPAKTESAPSAPIAAAPVAPAKLSRSTSGKVAIELQPIIVRPQQRPGPPAAPAQEPLQANIIMVNSEQNFVIIDRGSDSGVKPGDKFAAYRDKDEVGYLQAVEARKGITACDIVKALKPLKNSDIVRPLE